MKLGSPQEQRPHQVNMEGVVPPSTEVVVTGLCSGGRWAHADDAADREGLAKVLTQISLHLPEAGRLGRLHRAQEQIPRKFLYGCRRLKGEEFLLETGHREGPHGSGAQTLC